MKSKKILSLVSVFALIFFGACQKEKTVNEEIETVASPAIGGLVIGYAVAQSLNVRFIWTERQNGEMTVRDERLAPFESEALLAEELHLQEVLELLGAAEQMQSAQ